jgi:hypothetical protein
MTREEKETFDAGVITGVILTLIGVILCGVLSWLTNPISMIHPNAALNSEEFTIDTIRTINGVDTTTTYKFRQLK